MQSLAQKLAQAKEVYAFGAILMDEIPQGRTLGGSAFNFSYYVHHLGKKVTLTSGVGDDADGRYILSEMKRFGMESRFIEINTKYPTGLVKVHLDAQGAATFTVREQTAYDYVSRVPAVAPGSLIYFGSPEQRGDVSKDALRNCLSQHTASCVVFCDINLRKPYYNAETIGYSLSHTHCLKMSIEELRESALVLGWKEASETKRVERLFQSALLEIVLITKGPLGATLYRRKHEGFHVPAPAVPKLVDTVGAGDAFCARFLTKMMSGATAEQAVISAVKFASGLCAYAGAILDLPVLAQLAAASE